MADPRELVIEPGRSSAGYWRELWHYRELFWFLAWRDLLVRYKQTVIGVAWGVLRPLLTMIVFTVVFGKLARLPSEGVPYAVLVFSAMLPWQFFSTALSDCSNSLVNDASLLTKVYFPRMVIPASSVVVSFVDFAISFGILLALSAWYGVWPHWRMLALPLFVLLAASLAFGLGILFAAMNARYRDFRYLVPFLVQLGLYVSPVGFSSSIVPEKWRLLYSLNPLVGVIDGFRWAVLGGRVGLDWRSVLVSVAFAAVALVLAIVYFRATERVMADVI